MSIRPLLADLGYAVRQFRRSPALALAIILPLSLAAGAGTAVLSLVYGYLVRALPYPDAERLYNIIWAREGVRTPRGLDSKEWPKWLDPFAEHVGMWDLDVFMMTGASAERASGAWVTPGFFGALGVRPALGRVFSPDEGATDGTVAVISHSLWQSRFGGDPQVLGKAFRAYTSDRPEDAELFTIIGVLSPEFWFLHRYTDVLAPLRGPGMPYLVKLRRGVTTAEAEERVTAHARSLATGADPAWRVTLDPPQRRYTAAIRPVLVALGAAVVLVLGIACGNAAFLLLARAAGRSGEIAVRIALGASRGTIARQLFAEGLLLALASLVLGAMFAHAALEAFGPAVELQLGRPIPGGSSGVVLRPAVLAASLGVSVLTALFFGAVPLWTTLGTSVAQVIQGAGRGGTMSRARRRSYQALIAAEFALSLALATGAILMIRTTIHLQRTELGYSAERVVVTGIGLRQRSYPEVAQRAAFYDRLLDRLKALPGLESASLSGIYPVGLYTARPVEGSDSTVAGQAAASERPVTPEYFQTLSIPLLNGRVFTPQDRAGAPAVAVINVRLARRLWGELSALGRRIRFPSATGGEAEWLTVVGVAGDTRQSVLGADVDEVYVPLAQRPGRFVHPLLRLREGGPAPLSGVREAVTALDRDVSVTSLEPLNAVISREGARFRFLAWLLGGFAAAAAVLAAFGVFSVIAYVVRQREREAAIRMAVGASGSSVMWLMLRQGLTPALAGLAAGVPASSALASILGTQIHGVAPGDPATRIAGVALLAVVAFAAAWRPSRRAARIDPAQALRAER